MILITGASGFLGKNLCDEFLNRKIPFEAVARNESDFSSFLKGKGIKVHIGNMYDAKFIDSLVKGKDKIIHLAGKISSNNKDELLVGD